MNIKLFEPLSRASMAVCLLLGMLAAAPYGFAATDVEIEGSITDGIAWLVDNQAADGSWGGNQGTPVTCFVLIKLQDRAYELGFDSPFDADYPYSAAVLAGWQYVFGGGRTLMQAIVPQPAGDPDSNGNGYGVYFQYDGFHDNYTTGICLMALASTGTPDRENDGGLDFDGDASPDTYRELAQETVDFLAFAQTDGGTGQGGWAYNWTWTDWSDNSHSGYVTMGLAAAENFGLTVPQWVKEQLSIWIDYIQNDVNGGSGYSDPDNWINALKTGNLLFEMTFVGDTTAAPRFQAALGYIEDNWRVPGSGLYDFGWGYDTYPAHYQAMFTLMKGLEYSGVELIDTDGDSVRDNNWFNQDPTATPSEDLASVLVAQQTAAGFWPAQGWGNEYLSTLWALLTLEKIAPTADPFDITVSKDYRYTAVCFERDNDYDGLFNEDPVDFDDAGRPIDNDGDGLFNEDDVDCDPSYTGYWLPITSDDPEAYTVEAVLKKNGTVSSYNPGQYYAVSTVEVCRSNPTIDSVWLTIEEDFAECTVSDYPLSSLNPKTGGGSVVVVEVMGDVAYQIYDAMSGAITIEYVDGLEAMATASFEYTFGPDQECAMLLVYVKFAPGLKGLNFSEVPSYMCENFNRATLDVFDDTLDDPIFTTDDEANAWLKVVE